MIRNLASLFIPLFLFGSIGFGETPEKNPLLAHPDFYTQLPDSSQYDAYTYFATEYSGDDLIETKATALLALASLHKENYNYDLTVDYALQAKDQFQKINDLRRVGVCYNLLGNVFMEVGNFQKSEEYYNATADLAQTEKDTFGLAIAYNNLAGLRYRKKAYKEAENFYYSSIKYFYQLNKDSLAIQTQLNLTSTVMETDPDRALVLLNECIDFFSKGTPSPGTEAFITGNLGAIYYRKNDATKAIEHYLKSIAISETNDLKRVTLVNYTDISEIYETVGDYKNALLFDNKADSLKNAITTAEEREKAETLEFNYYIGLKNEKARSLALQFEKKKLEARELNYLFWLVGTLLIILIFLTLAIVLFYRYRTHQAQQKKEMLMMKNKIIASNLEQAQMSSENLQKELDMNKEDLINFSIDIRRKNEIQEKIHNGIKNLKPHVKNNREVMGKIRELMLLSSTNIKLNEDNEQISSNIDKVNHDFFQRLSEKFPNLTTNEKKLCGLIRIKTSIKEIASIRGISPKSVEMSRYRLKKKLELTEGQHLDQFIEQI